MTLKDCTPEKLLSMREACDRTIEKYKNRDRSIKCFFCKEAWVFADKSCPTCAWYIITGSGCATGGVKLSNKFKLPATSTDLWCHLYNYPEAIQSRINQLRYWKGLITKELKRRAK